MTKDNKTVSCYDKHARSYDIYQSVVVPGYEEMLSIAAQACQRYLPDNPEIIDLGCGTGNATLAILKRIPARVFLIDGSRRMVDVACEKVSLAWRDTILGCKVADLSQDGWDAGLEGGKYDAIVSTLVLEHLPFDTYRLAIEKCFQLLRPGGWLLASEGYDEPGSDMREWFFGEMENRRKMLDPEISDSVAKERNENEVHYYCSKSEKAMWWRKTGFVDVNVLWQYLCIALMAGRKPFSLPKKTRQIVKPARPL